MYSGGIDEEGPASEDAKGYRVWVWPQCAMPELHSLVVLKLPWFVER